MAAGKQRARRRTDGGTETGSVADGRRQTQTARRTAGWCDGTDPRRRETMSAGTASRDVGGGGGGVSSSRRHDDNRRLPFVSSTRRSLSTEINPDLGRIT